MPRVAIKGHAAADFISELTPMKEPEDRPEMCEVTMAPKDDSPRWKLYVDGSVTKDKSGAGIILISPDGFKYNYALEFRFSTSNNAVEYEALIRGLQLAQEIGTKSVQVFSDSQLVVNQVNTKSSCELALSSPTNKQTSKGVE